MHKLLRIMVVSHATDFCSYISASFTNGSLASALSEYFQNWSKPWLRIADRSLEQGVEEMVQVELEWKGQNSSGRFHLSARLL